MRQFIHNRIYVNPSRPKMMFCAQYSLWIGVIILPRIQSYNLPHFKQTGPYNRIASAQQKQTLVFFNYSYISNHCCVVLLEWFVLKASFQGISKKRQENFYVAHNSLLKIFQQLCITQGILRSWLKNFLLHSCDRLLSSNRCFSNYSYKSRRRTSTDICHHNTF